MEIDNKTNNMLSNSQVFDLLWRIKSTTCFEYIELQMIKGKFSNASYQKTVFDTDQIEHMWRGPKGVKVWQDCSKNWSADVSLV